MRSRRIPSYHTLVSGVPVTISRLNGAVCNYRGWSAYPPTLSIIADIPIPTLSANNGREQVQQNAPQKALNLLNNLVGARQE